MGIYIYIYRNSSRIAESQFALDPWLQNSLSKDVQPRDNAAYRKAMLSGFQGQALLAPSITKTNPKP